MAYRGDVRTEYQRRDGGDDPSLELLISEDDPGRCPPDEKIWNAGGHDADVVETRRLIAHLSGCPTCFRAWRVARAMRRREVLEVVGDPTSAHDTAYAAAP